MERNFGFWNVHLNRVPDIFQLLFDIFHEEYNKYEMNYMGVL